MNLVLINMVGASHAQTAREIREIRERALQAMRQWAIVTIVHAFVIVITLS